MNKLSDSSNLIEIAIASMLEEKGYSVKDRNFMDTPVRVAKVYDELIGNVVFIKKEAKEILKKATFPSKYGGIILVKGIQAVGMCPHHLSLVFYNMDFAYIPKNDVVGLSKVPRFLKKMSSLLLLQEDLTEECLDVFNTVVKPKGSMIVVNGVHSCMKARGVKEVNASMQTIGVRGNFQDLSVKTEVLQSLSR